jgi:glycosyltransferase involved in cell wall biosynthesis
LPCTVLHWRRIASYCNRSARTSANVNQQTPASPSPPAALAEPTLELSVIVPARNEEASIEACLRSLAAQSEEIFALGTDWEILLVDDNSTDRTRSIAEAIPGVIVLNAAALRKGWTGKANAVWTGVQQARGRWLLFTDADTVHEPGNLRRAIHEAEKYHVAALSYSPRQLVSGFWQSAIMPLVFCELALSYPPAKVSDPESRLAAANGQFLLFRRDAYFQIGGHEAVADSILEDVDLAHLVKRRKLGLRFRYAPDALATRMYRTFAQMWEGWTKNLDQLFGNCLALAAWRVLDIALILGLPMLALYFYQPVSRAAFLLLWARTLWRFYRRVARSNFPAVDCAISVFGLPLFAAMLYSSWFHHHVLHTVSWKGRDYPAGKG